MGTQRQHGRGHLLPLPRSLVDTKLVTNAKVEEDEEVLEARRHLVDTKSPAELSTVTSLSDIPIPSGLQNLWKVGSRSVSRAGSKPGSAMDVNDAKRRRSRSASLPKGVRENLYNTLPKAWREQNLVTNVKTETDMDKVEKRKEITENKTVQELSKITSIADLPIPTRLENFLKNNKQTNENDTENEQTPKFSVSKMNVNDTYNTLPKSLKIELAVTSKVEDNAEIIEQRKKLVEEKNPSELAHIGSLADFPLPSALENIFKQDEKPTPPQ